MSSITRNASRTVIDAGIQGALTVGRPTMPILLMMLDVLAGLN